MKHGRAVAVQHALRIARGTARVAQSGRGFFVELGPAVVFGSRLDPGFVTHQPGKARIGWKPITVAECDPVLHSGAVRGNRTYDRQERQIETDRFVFRIIDDPRDLFRRKPRIDGVQHARAAAYAVVQLEVAVPIPSQRRHPLASGDTERIERISHLATSTHGRLIVVAVQVALDAPRDHLGGRMISGCELDKPPNQQRMILHCTQHEYPLDTLSRDCSAVVAAAPQTPHTASRPMETTRETQPLPWLPTTQASGHCVPQTRPRARRAPPPSG